MNPMVDGWMGDDWFHYGAFRQQGMPNILGQEATRDNDVDWWTDHVDDDTASLRAGNAREMGRRRGLEQVGFWRKILEHPACDACWQGQAVDRLLAARPLTVPTMLVHSLWDQEDIYGDVAVWEALKGKEPSGQKLHLVLGPWHHGQAIGDGSSLGPLRFGSDTALTFRREVLRPFLDQYLKERAPEYEEWVSDPATPVPYRPRPVLGWGYDTANSWSRWLVDDLRHASCRTDVVTFVSEVLTEPLKISGRPVANLVASTSGTDADWVVKLIDVWPDEVAGQPETGGWEPMVSADVFRGRYRESFDTPKAIAAGETLAYRFALPTANHVFLPGHRVMVQVQSSWFPLYDRNPQTFVPSVFDAKPGDYRKAVQRVFHAPGRESFVELPVVSARYYGER